MNEPTGLLYDDRGRIRHSPVFFREEIGTNADHRQRADNLLRTIWKMIEPNVATNQPHVLSVDELVGACRGEHIPPEHFIGAARRRQAYVKQASANGFDRKPYDNRIALHLLDLSELAAGEQVITEIGTDWHMLDPYRTSDNPLWLGSQSLLDYEYPISQLEAPTHELRMFAHKKVLQLLRFFRQSRKHELYPETTMTPPELHTLFNSHLRGRLAYGFGLDYLLGAVKRNILHTYYKPYGETDFADLIHIGFLTGRALNSSEDPSTSILGFPRATGNNHL